MMCLIFIFGVIIGFLTKNSAMICTSLICASIWGASGWGGVK